ncbi:MAG: flippase-like domain-containing protein [Candidatus Scalindua sp.]|jgi:glycosyltransferase 2 family protein|nr:flippase-like domain-containing protein [Candidatus Scalindua sp.]MBT6228863.1 flippase-like domain-containing protein [Candidatus Scalindua sp.]
MDEIKKHLKKIGYIVSIIFLYFTFKDTDFSLILKHLKYVSPYCLIGALIFNCCFFVIRGLYQTNNLYYIKPNIPGSTSITAIGVAQFYNVIFPARFGEVFRAFFLSKREGVQKASILSYIFIEKVLDFLVILLLLLIISVFGVRNAEVRKVLICSFLIIVSIISSLFIYIRYNEKMLFVLERVTPKSIHGLLHRISSEVLQGLSFFKSIKQIVTGIILLLTSWMMITGVFWCVSYPYVKLLELPFYSCLFFMVFSALSLSVPSAPAGIGVMHYGLFLAVKLLSKDFIETEVNLIAAFVISMHFFVMLFDVLVGGGIIVFHKIYFKDILVPGHNVLEGEL